MAKYIFLSEEELKREENLFAPHEISYKPLAERDFDIRTYKPPVAEGDEMLQVLGSC